MTQSYVQLDSQGRASSFVGPDATHLFAAMTLRAGIKLYLECGLIPTRGMTITRMLASVTRFSNKKYRRNAAIRAVEDLTVWIDAMKCALPMEQSS